MSLESFRQYCERYKDWRSQGRFIGANEDSKVHDELVLILFRYPGIMGITDVSHKFKEVPLWRPNECIEGCADLVFFAQNEAYLCEVKVGRYKNGWARSQLRRLHSSVYEQFRVSSRLLHSSQHNGADLRTVSVSPFI